MDPEVEEEIEVVRAIYGEEAVSVEERSGAVDDVTLRLFVNLQPRVEQGAALVSVTLAVDLPLGYPSGSAPRIHVERSRGLGDAALSALLAAARRAVEEFGLTEVGCVSQVLAEVSEALDVANDASECNICLSVCEPGQPVVRATCDHVFHSDCIGHWRALKDAEAEAAASDATQSARAERDALRRELAEAQAREVEAAMCVEDLREQAAARTRRLDVARALARGEDIEDDYAVADAEILGEEESQESDLPPTVQQLMEKAQMAKAELQKAQTAARRAQGRCSELQRKYEDLDATLAREAADRAMASLPCPVCKVPIARSLLPAPDTGRASAPPSAEAGATMVRALPAELLRKVREVQKEHKAILERRRVKEEEEAAKAEAPADDPVGNDRVAPAAETPAATHASTGTSVPRTAGGAGRGSRRAHDANPAADRDIRGAGAGAGGKSRGRNGVGQWDQGKQWAAADQWACGDNWWPSDAGDQWWTAGGGYGGGCGGGWANGKNDAASADTSATASPGSWSVGAGGYGGGWVAGSNNTTAADTNVAAAPGRRAGRWGKR